MWGPAPNDALVGNSVQVIRPSDQVVLTSTSPTSWTQDDISIGRCVGARNDPDPAAPGQVHDFGIGSEFELPVPGTLAWISE